MKRFFITLMLGFLILQCAHAQIEKGYNLAGGAGRIGFDSDQFSIYLSPDLGWFIKDRFPVGGNLTFYVSDTENSTNFTLSFGPFVRYYFGNARTKVFVHGGMGISSDTYSYNYAGNKEKNSDFDLYFDLRAGIAFFITEQVALEAALVYQSYSIIDEYSGSFGISAGFQIHIFKLFNKNKEAE
jgi:hypothetical protein